MISIKTKEEIEAMRQGGRVLKSVVDALGEMVRPGVSGLEIEKAAEELILKSGGKSNFKGQDGFPSVLCFSINEEVVHGLPDKRVLKEGDIVTLDLGIFFPLSRFVSDIDEKKYPSLKDGFHTDMARTYVVGRGKAETQRLVKASKKALKRGISRVRAGRSFGEIGAEIEKFAHSQGFEVIHDLCGHGIGADLHEDPDVLNYGDKDWGDIIEEGMVFCIEPMLTTGGFRVRKGKGITYITEDGSLSAHFEDMVAVVPGGVLVLTE
ncbi:MAG: type I methionyl aminopeptidase [Candidatus Paceibacterota bacterium]